LWVILLGAVVIVDEWGFLAVKAIASTQNEVLSLELFRVNLPSLGSESMRERQI